MTSSTLASPALAQLDADATVRPTPPCQSVDRSLQRRLSCPGDIVVVREADNLTTNTGLSYPSGGNALVYLDEYNVSGPTPTLVQTVTMPYIAGNGMAGNQAFTLDPSNGSGCGALNLTFDSSALVMAANDTNPGTTDAVAKTADRVIGHEAEE